MILCVCHRLSDRQIRKVCAESHAATVSCVYRCLGCRPQCGKCVPDVREMLRATRLAAGKDPATADAPVEEQPGRAA